MENTASVIRRAKDRYAMITFYMESRKMRCSAETNEQCRERLNTVFDDLIDNYHVVIEEEKIAGLTGTVLQKWFIHFMNDRKPSTINNYLAFLNPFLEWAFTIGYISTDMSHLLKYAKGKKAEQVSMWEKQPEEKYLTHEEAFKLLHTEITGENANRNRAIIALFLYSGIRVSELCSLTMRSVLESPEGYIYCRRKGGAWKYVEVAAPFYNYLSEYLLERDDRDDMDAPLFITNRGGFMDRRLIYLTIAPIQKRLGIATGSHALRHTFISEVDKIGGPTIARDLANHSTIKITNRYDHTTKEQRRKVLDCLKWDE